METAGQRARVRYRFLGHVQSRGFRYACVQCAEREQVTGWVRNESDGTVTAEVQGTEGQQAGFVRRLSSLVPGFGDSWTIASEHYRNPQDAEKTFEVRRY